MNDPRVDVVKELLKRIGDAPKHGYAGDYYHDVAQRVLHALDSIDESLQCVRCDRPPLAGTRVCSDHYERWAT